MKVQICLSHQAFDCQVSTAFFNRVIPRVLWKSGGIKIGINPLMPGGNKKVTNT